MVEINQILQNLDKHAKDLNFPVLDNAYIELADTRLTVFRSEGDWVIIFEMVGFATEEIEFVNDIYAYGSCVVEQGFQGEEIPLQAPPGQPILDPETNDCIADWKHWSVLINNQEFSFSPTIRDYAEAGLKISPDLSGPGSIREREILRFLVHHLNHPFFAPDKKLLEFLSSCKRLSKFLQTHEWQHPDVGGGELPSQNVSMQSLSRTIVESNPALFNPGKINTQWQHWDWHSNTTTR